jgi:hypothetical protein
MAGIAPDVAATLAHGAQPDVAVQLAQAADPRVPPNYDPHARDPVFGKTLEEVRKIFPPGGLEERVRAGGQGQFDPTAEGLNDKDRDFIKNLPDDIEIMEQGPNYMHLRVKKPVPVS